MNDTSLGLAATQNLAETVSQNEGNDIRLATQWQKIFLVFFHLALAIGMIFGTYVTIQKFNEATFAEISTPWKLPDGASLKDGPPTLHYDPELHVLSHRGALELEEQAQLRALIELNTEFADKKPPSFEPASTADINITIHSYQAAIAKLATLAGAKQIDQIQLLLLLGIMGGILGAILRSLVDFVGHACYTGKLDLMHWWPLYATRPLIGAILGFVLVVLLKARLLTSPDIQQGNESFWWLGVAVLGGFSTVDVTQRLRLAAKAIFGTAREGKRDGA